MSLSLDYFEPETQEYEITFHDANGSTRTVSIRPKANKIQSVAVYWPDDFDEPIAPKLIESRWKTVRESTAAKAINATSFGTRPYIGICLTDAQKEKIRKIFERDAQPMNEFKEKHPESVFKNVVLYPYGYGRSSGTSWRDRIKKEPLPFVLVGLTPFVIALLIFSWKNEPGERRFQIALSIIVWLILFVVNLRIILR